MKRGYIKTFLADRGFGFIRPEGGGSDLYFRKEVVDDRGYPLEEGTPVEYEEGPGREPGKQQATRVVLTGFPPEANRSSASGGKRAAAEAPKKLPPECVFTDSFYNPAGCLREELFYQAAQRAADVFRAAGLKASQLRQLYNGLLSIAGPLRDKSLTFEAAKERFGIFYCERVVRQFERGVIPPVVKDFFDQHRSLALSGDKELLGLFRYLTNIYCYFGESEKSS